jgi:hypothetical protein
MKRKKAKKASLADYTQIHVPWKVWSIDAKTGKQSEISFEEYQKREIVRLSKEVHDLSARNAKLRELLGV